MTVEVTLYPPESHAFGQFDGGNIREQKPIGFPGERGAVTRIGPLFYWAWFEGEGLIPAHPHQAFEIVTYVLSGRVEHRDNLGFHSVVGTGGAQVLQAGSGAVHEERLIDIITQGFQIWCEPYYRDALKRAPAYACYEPDVFPLQERNGACVRTVIGEGSPIALAAECAMQDILLQPGASFAFDIPPGYAVAALALEGRGTMEGTAGIIDVAARDFVVARSGSGGKLRIVAERDNGLRFFSVAVPECVDYPVYNKG